MGKKTELPPNVINFSGNFEKLVEEAKKIGEDKLIVVEFFATWCKGCRRFNDLLPNAAKSNETVTFFKVDVDKNEEFTDSMKVINSQIPCLMFYKLKDEKLNKLDEVQQGDIKRLQKKIDALIA